MQPFKAPEQVWAILVTDKEISRQWLLPATDEGEGFLAFSSEFDANQVIPLQMGYFEGEVELAPIQLK